MCFTVFYFIDFLFGEVSSTAVCWQVDYQGNVTLLTQAIYMSKCKVRVSPGNSPVTCHMSPITCHLPTDPPLR